MALVWVTGTSGVGKRTVCEALKESGLVAVDADWDGYSRWVDRGRKHVVTDAPYPTPPGWMKDHAWETDVERVRALAHDVADDVGFLVGSVETELDVWDRSAAVRIVVDDETLRHRLATGRRTS